MTCACHEQFPFFWHTFQKQSVYTMKANIFVWKTPVCLPSEIETLRCFAWVYAGAWSFTGDCTIRRAGNPAPLNLTSVFSFQCSRGCINTSYERSVTRTGILLSLSLSLLSVRFVLFFYWPELRILKDLGLTTDRWKRDSPISTSMAGRCCAQAKRVLAQTFIV